MKLAGPLLSLLLALPALASDASSEPAPRTAWDDIQCRSPGGTAGPKCFVCLNTRTGDVAMNGCEPPKKPAKKGAKK